MIFDTLKLSKTLQGAFTPAQAEALTEAFSSTSQNARDDLATKSDLSNVALALKGDILVIKTDLNRVETTLRGEIQNLKVETVKWIVPAIAFNLLGTAGLIIALLKLAR